MSANSNRINSWLAQAAYLNFVPVLEGAVPYVRKLTINDGVADDKRFATAQADSVTDPTNGFGLLHQLPNTSNGTSATIFKSNNAFDGSYTIAVRGTEPGSQGFSDLFQDALGVVLAGKAKVQLIEAFRYYKRATTPGGQAVVYNSQEIAAMGRVLFSGTVLAPASALENIAAAITYFRTLSANDLGLGASGETLIPPGARINFTGHSLGGHVAYLLAQLVDSTASDGRLVGDVMTYNAPGQDALLYEVQNWLGINTSTQSGSIGGKHLAFYGEGGLNVTAGLGRVIGTRKPVFIEGEGIASGDLLTENHSIVKLGDSLALYELMARLDPSISDESIKGILKAGANRGLDSLDAELDVLRRIILGASISPTKALGANDSREQYYANLATLDETITQSGFAGAFEIRALPSSASMVARAKQNDAEGLAYRYALKELNPFVLIGPATVYASHNANGELDRYSAAADTGALTDLYLADRASFLSWKNQKNIKDIDDDTALQRTDFGAESFLFTDRTLKNAAAQDYNVRVLGGNALQRIDPIRILFGGDSAETLAGSTYADHLYGGAATDTLTGGEGNDYLEGGGGNDQLSGDDGNDILIGGAGDDVLAGGDGSNRLEGGSGFDTYELSGSGLQVIVDADGVGRILADGVVLAGGARTGDHRYASDDGEVQYTFVGDPASGGTLIINGTVTIQNFHDGDLGIALGQDDTPDSPRSPGRYVVSDDDDPTDINDRIIFAAAFDPGLGEHGEWVVDHIDVMTGSGNDAISTAGNHVYVSGGQHSDYLTGVSWLASVGDTFAGGAGTDIIYGSGGNDRLFGEEEADVDIAIEAGASGGGTGQLGDWLVGRDGNDVMVGGAGDDVLFGGSGDNTLVGGQGDDHIYGDESAESNLAYGFATSFYPLTFSNGFNFTWTFRQATLRNDRHQEVPTNAPNPESSPGAGDNRIYAGAGDDWVSGGAGDDYIDGGEGDDTLHGDDGINVMLGGEGADLITSGSYGHHSGGYIDGGDGDDQILALSGHYIIDGGAGNDLIQADTGNIEPGTYFIYGGEGNDTIFGTYGNDYLEGEEGADVIRGNGGDDFITGGAGDDYLEVMTGAAELFGDDGNDVLAVVANADGSVLDGGEGDDEYAFFAGAGDVAISDSSGSNRIVLVSGELIDEIEIIALSVHFEWSESQLSLRYGDGGDRIRLADDTALPSVEILHATEFAGGYWVGEREAVLFDTLTVEQVGSENDDYLTARPGFGNVLAGMAGNDTLTGSTGGDILSGGAGDDVLDGRAGNDIYIFNAGDGDDTIAERDANVVEADTLRLGTGIQAGAIDVRQSYDDLVLVVGGADSGDSITIASGVTIDVIARLEFSDGTVWNNAYLRSVAVPDPVPAFDSPPGDQEAGVPVHGGAPVSADLGDGGAPSASGDDEIAADPKESTTAPTDLAGAHEMDLDVFGDQGAAFDGGFISNNVGVGNGADPAFLETIPVPTAAASTTPAGAPSFASGGGGERGAVSTGIGNGNGGIGSIGRTESTGSRTRDSLRSASAGALGDSDQADAQASIENASSGGASRSPNSDAAFLPRVAQQDDTNIVTTPALTSWALTNALLQFRMDNADEAALLGGPSDSIGRFGGGSLAYAGLGSAQTNLGLPGFGSDAQNLRSFSGLSEGMVALGA